MNSDKFENMVENNEEVSTDKKRVFQKIQNHAKLIINDLVVNNEYKSFIHKYKKEDVIRWLDNPSFFSYKLIEISNYLYVVSNYYKRLINYFALIHLLPYVILPNDVDFSRKNTVKRDYKKASKILKNINPKRTFSNIFKICFRDDVFYGATFHGDDFDSFYVKPLPSKYCMISYVQDGIYGFRFNFAYFKAYPNKLKMYGKWFEDQFNLLKSNRKVVNGSDYWVQVPLEVGFAMKWDETVDYPLPPLVGVFASLFDIEDYKKLKKIRQEIGNYKLLVMDYPYDDNGEPLIDWDEIEGYYDMLNASVPDNIGTTVIPNGKLTDISFERNGESTADLVEEATNDFYNNAGVSQLLFGSSKSGNSIISASTEIDSTYMDSLIRQTTCYLNYVLRYAFNGKAKFKVQLLDVTIFNKDTQVKNLLEMGTYGISGTISKIAAIQGMDLCDLDNMSSLENDVFDLNNKFIPFKSSHTQTDTSNTGGAPTKDDDEISDSANITRERDETKTS